MPITDIQLNGKPLSQIRRVACISTSRADSGIYRSLWRALIDAGYETTCLAGGTHLDAARGRSIDDLRRIDGLRVAPVAHSTGDGTAAGVAAAAGEAMGAFGRAIEASGPDVVFVLGDRVEMLAAAMSAVSARAPLAHLHGGERTAGAYDDQCRDAITMLSNLHFASTPQYAARIRSMGAEASRVFSVGALALDRLCTFRPMSVEATSRAVGLDLSKPTLLVLFHPETLSRLPASEQARIVVEALRGVEAQLLIFGVNADVGSGAVAEAMTELSKHRDGARWMASATPDIFYSCMSHARAMVGNSSSGIIEATSVGLPVVNIGNRQGGRLRAANVLDVPFECAAIVEAINRASATSFRESLSGMVNPYGDGHAASRIVSVLQGRVADLFDGPDCSLSC